MRWFSPDITLDSKNYHPFYILPSLLQDNNALTGAHIEHHAHAFDMLPQFCVIQIIKNRQVNGVGHGSEVGGVPF